MNKNELKKWKIVVSKKLFSNKFITIDEIKSLREGDKRNSTFYRMHFPRWVNIIPVTPLGEVLFIKQFRHGIQSETLEIPGGIIEENEVPIDGAKRELLEETGYSSNEWVDLGFVSPNPAIQSNLCYVFLAKNVVKTNDTDFDPDEEIFSKLVPLDKLSETIALEVNNAIVLSSFALAWAKNKL